MNVLLILVLFTPAPPQDQPTDPHRHVLTPQFPIPDTVKDPQLRKLLSEGLSEARTRKLFQTAEERERFMKWAQEATKSPASGEDMWRSLLESNPELRSRLESRSPDPSHAPPGEGRLRNLDDGTRRKLQELVGRIANHANSRPFDRGDGRFPTPPGFDRHSPAASEFMRRFLGNRDFKFDLSRGLSEGLSRFQNLLNRWGGSSGSTLDSSPLVIREGSRTLPGAGGGGGSGGSSQSLPSLPGPALPGIGSAVGGSGIIIAALALAAVVVAIVLLARRRPHAASLLKQKVWPRPRIPERFASAEVAAAAYRDVVRFALQRPLTGLSHLEIESAVVGRHPSTAKAARVLTSGFESLYYDPETGRDPLKPNDASRFL